MCIFDWLFGWTSDNRRRGDGDQEVERKLSLAIPMVGAASELQARPGASDTVRAAWRVAKSNARVSLKRGNGHVFRCAGYRL
jgi:hypothetical protein